MAAKRQTVIALTAGAGIALALGVMASINTDRPDPQAVKAELQAKLVQLDEIQDPITREKFAKELLANELYRELAKALHGRLERALPKIREAAALERSAMKEVPPFLAKCKDLRRVPYAELELLYGEAGSLLRNYGTTRHGEELKRLVEELKTRCELIPRCTAKDVIELSGDVQKLLKEEKDVDAEERIREFVTKYFNIAEFDTQIRQLRQQVVRHRAAREPRKR